MTTCLGFFVMKLNAQVPALDWVQAMGGDDSDQGRSCTVDDSGNVYITGSFRKTADFDPGPGTTNLVSNGNLDFFVQKLDEYGNLLWVFSMGAEIHDVGESIAIDPSGNIYVTGYFQGTVDFDPGPGINNLTSNGTNTFVLKLTPEGNFLWAKCMVGIEYSNNGHSISTDAFGNVYVMGVYHGTVDFDPGPGTTLLTNEGAGDIFVQKLDASGNLLWIRSVGGESFDIGWSSTTDDAGNVYVTGYFSETADFDPSSGIMNLVSNGGREIFVLKLGASGDFHWARSVGGTGQEQGNSIAVDPSGNVYVTGYFQGEVDFDPGPGSTILNSVAAVDIFVQKLNASGNLLWAISAGGYNHDAGRSIVTDPLGNVYLTGYFQGTVDFDPGPGIKNLYSSGAEDIFVQKMDASGNLLWAISAGGAAHEQGNSILVKSSGLIYITGFFQSTPDFDPSPETSYKVSSGLEDVFVLKLDESPVGIADIDHDLEVKIFPNPTKDNLNIESPQKVQIEIFDSFGRLIISRLENSQTESIDLSAYASGVYYVRISSGNRTITKKVMKT